MRLKNRLQTVRKFRTTKTVKKQTKASRPRGKAPKKGKVVKKSLSYTPAAWRAIETLAKRNARASGSTPNFSDTASRLVLAGAGAN